MEYIKEICIDSFRGIENLCLSELSQINIITGDNNCGKTSILEVIDSFRQPDDIYAWNSLTRRDGIMGNRNGMTFYDGIYDLFNINHDKKRIKYSLKNENTVLELVADADESLEEMSEKDYADLIGMYITKKNRAEFEGQIRIVTKMQFEVKLNKKDILHEIIYESQRYSSRIPLRKKKSNIHSQNIIYISPIRHATGTVFLSDVLNSPELYEEMLTILKEYDENIISINYDNDNEYTLGQGGYKILSKSHKKALPLNVYGDGMKKAILLMSAVIRAKDGVLLLDEFETAIHTSAMEKTFKWILQTCKRLNVQVFMTSHSIEAISKVLKCCPDMKNDIRMITLVDTQEGIKIRNVNATKAIQLMDDYGLELR